MTGFVEDGATKLWHELVALIGPAVDSKPLGDFEAERLAEVRDELDEWFRRGGTFDGYAGSVAVINRSHHDRLAELDRRVAEALKSGPPGSEETEKRLRAADFDYRRDVVDDLAEIIASQDLREITPRRLAEELFAYWAGR